MSFGSLSHCFNFFLYCTLTFFLFPFVLCCLVFCWCWRWLRNQAIINDIFIFNIFRIFIKQIILYFFLTLFFILVFLLNLILGWVHCLLIINGWKPHQSFLLSLGLERGSYLLLFCLPLVLVDVHFLCENILPAVVEGLSHV